MGEEEREQAVDRWFRMYSGRVLSYLLHRTDPQTAQDLVQDVFVVAFRKADDVPEPALGWLFGTARRLLANKTRGLRRRDQLVERMAVSVSESVDAEQAETMQAFLAVLERLSSRDREVLTLTGWYDLTPAEAAQVLGCSPATYAVRLHRARQRLTDQLSRTGSPGGSPSAHLQEALREH